MSGTRASGSRGTADREYLDAVAFVEVGKDRKVKPRTVGYAWTTESQEYGKQMHIQVQMIPAPGNGWNGEIVVQKRRERDDDGSAEDNRSAPRDNRRRER